MNKDSKLGLRNIHTPLKRIKESIDKSRGIYEDALKNLNLSIQHIKGSIDKLQGIDRDTPLKIELVKKEEKKETLKIVGYFGALIFALILAFIWLFFVVNKKVEPVKTKSEYLKGYVVYPAWTSIDDEGIIQLTLTNNSGTAIKEVKSSLIYKSGPAFAIISKNGSTIMDFGVIEAHETKSQKVNFLLKEFDNKWTIKFELNITLAKAAKNPKPPEITIGIIPVSEFKGIIKVILIFLLNSVLLPVFLKKIK